MDSIVLMKAIRAFCFLILLCAALSAAAFADAPAEQFGDQVLCLYRSSEGYSAANNPLKRYCDRELRALGLEPVYRDADGGLAGIKTSRLRGAVSWFDGLVAKDRASMFDYISFLSGMLDAGRRVAVINSFGAYGYREEGENIWLDAAYFNPVFKRIGFQFMGCGSANPKKISIARKSPAMVEKEAKQDISFSRHYQRFVPLADRGDVRSYLVLKLSDPKNPCGQRLGDTYSSVVMTSDRGGFALEKYVVRDGKLLLNTMLFLKRALFAYDDFQRVGVLVDSASDRAAVVDNIERSLRMARISFDLIDPSLVSRMLPADLARYSAVIYAGDGIPDRAGWLLEEYARGGGSVVVLRGRAVSPDPKRLLGIRSSGEARELRGAFTMEGALCVNGTPLRARMDGARLCEVELAGGSVIARADDPSLRERCPVAWRRETGSGRVLVWNIDRLAADPSFRGAIVQSLHAVVPGFVSGIANTGIMMIDRLPVDGDDDPARDWSADMLDIQRRYHVRFTAFADLCGWSGPCPREFNPESDSAKAYARAAAQGWEVGARLCGRDAGDLRELSERWKRCFGEKALPAVLADFSSETRLPDASFLTAFPSLKAVVVAGSKTGIDFSIMADTKLAAIRRSTSGFDPAGEGKRALYDGIHCAGMASHMIAAPAASGSRADWRAAKERFVEGIESVQSDFPWLRWMTVKEAADELRFYETVSMRVKRSPGVIEVITGNLGGKYFYFRAHLGAGRVIARLANCTLVNIHRDSGDFILKTAGPSCRVLYR